MPVGYLFNCVLQENHFKEKERQIIWKGKVTHGRQKTDYIYVPIFLSETSVGDCDSEDPHMHHSSCHKMGPAIE